MSIIYNLYSLGWNKNLEEQYQQYKQRYDVGRVAVEYKSLYKVLCQNGEVLAGISGKLSYSAQGTVDYPAVGDWVLIERTSSSQDKTVICQILPRKSKFSRQASGYKTKLNYMIDEQVIAVNVDIVFICMDLNQNYNLRRLERYITMAWNSGAVPVILLTKADLCNDIENLVLQAKEAATGVDVYPISSQDNSWKELMPKYITSGMTVVFLGSSGVGKSTIINCLIGEERQKIHEISSTSSKGMHTTTNRELILLPSGGIVIDTPGMREFHILDVDENVDTTFEDINKLAMYCRFSDCSHTVEPDCAVLNAIQKREISQDRLDSYFKLKKEALFMQRKGNKSVERLQKEKYKEITREINNRLKEKYK